MSLATTKSKDIDGLTFKVSLLPVVHGREVMVRLQRTFGPALGELIDGGTKAGTARALVQVADRLDSKDFAWLCDVLAERCSVAYPDGREVPLKERQDDVFAGHYDRLLAWIEFCLEVNFASFFEKARKALDGLRATSTPSASQSPTASIGTSGA